VTKETTRRNISIDGHPLILNIRYSASSKIAKNELSTYVSFDIEISKFLIPE